MHKQRPNAPFALSGFIVINSLAFMRIYMSNRLKVLAYAHFTLGLCFSAGCGGSSNTVEMPVNPVGPPPSGPSGIEQGESGKESASESSALAAPPAVEP